jgi:hypothetical protein
MPTPAPDLPADFDPDAIPEYPGPGAPHDERGMDATAAVIAEVEAAEAAAAEPEPPAD